MTLKNILLTLALQLKTENTAFQETKIRATLVLIKWCLYGVLSLPETCHNAVTYRERLPRVSGWSKRLPSVSSSDSWYDQRYNRGEEIQTTLVNSMITLVDRQDSSAKYEIREVNL